MPWTPSDATRHTKKARTAKSKRQFAHVANSMLKRGASEGAAIRAANSVVKRSSRKSKRGKR
jgi:uncharacterized protein YdaT